MRRTASEVLRSLEMRVARLESQSFRSASSDDMIDESFELLERNGFEYDRDTTFSYDFEYRFTHPKFGSQTITVPFKKGVGSFKDEINRPYVVEKFLDAVPNIKNSIISKTLNKENLKAKSKTSFDTKMEYDFAVALLSHIEYLERPRSR
jgi:hypothetical protein